MPHPHASNASEPMPPVTDSVATITADGSIAGAAASGRCSDAVDRPRPGANSPLAGRQIRRRPRPLGPAVE